MTDLILCRNLSINDRDSRVLTVQVKDDNNNNGKKGLIKMNIYKNECDFFYGS